MERARTTLEDALELRELEFTAAYLTVCDLHSLIKTHPRIIRSKTVLVLEGVLRNSSFSSQTQSFFLYREASDALVSIILGSMRKRLADQALCTLQRLLHKTNGTAFRASAEALGSLPLAIRGPNNQEKALGNVPKVKWHDILGAAGITTGRAPLIHGRSLVMAIDEAPGLLVVKLASGENAARSVQREASWMDHLGSEGYAFPRRFNIPKPIKVQGNYVFRLKSAPMEMPKGMGPDPKPYGISFIAHKDYFSYPNDHRPEKRLDTENFKEVILRNAWLFARLTSMGIVHSAPIPLFHNRLQGHRRADRGLYEWQRGGRLDRWLHSCRYPNFGLTGVRDFEHITSFSGPSRELYNHIGSQILSLLLAIGSYFRTKDMGRVGFDGQGKVADARDLFDNPFLEELLRGIFFTYFHGFTGESFQGDTPCDFKLLASRMIEEMGVDHHMEEVLRVVDQRRMTEEDFSNFLARRGCSHKDIKSLQRGVSDIVIYTGPHLGGFNERISLPELVESVGAMSALCIAGRYGSPILPCC